MKTMLLALGETEKRIAAIRQLIEANPRLNEWDCSGLDFQTNLLQFFPRGIERHSLVSEASAKHFARAIGGTWERRYDGTWETRTCTIPGAGPCHIVLHHVARIYAERGEKIDLEA